MRGLRELLLMVLSDDSKLAIRTIQDINSHNGVLEHLDTHENNEEFFRTYFEGNVMGAVRATSFGDYRYTDDFVRFDDCGNLESLKHFEYVEEINNHMDEIVDAILDLNGECEFHQEIEDILEQGEVIEHYTFQTSTIFDELIADVGVDGISDLDVGEESKRHGIEFSHVESWEYDAGYLTIYVY